MSGYASTHDERTAAADCLNEVVAACQQIQVAIRETTPSGVLERDPSRRINAASRLVGLHQGVATDHLPAFTALLALPGSHGPSLATLDRSFCETWARAWWVMQATSSTRAEYRARAMVVAELEAGAKRGIALLSTERIGDGIKRAKGERDSIKVMSPEIVPTPTNLVKKLLEDCGATPAAAIYSHLSGVAHGESVFTESLTQRPWTGTDIVVALPSDNLNKYCTTLCSVTLIATAQLIRSWALSESDGDAFMQAATGAVIRLASVLRD
jgi:hypothetical protein